MPLHSKARNYRGCPPEAKPGPVAIQRHRTRHRRTESPAVARILCTRPDAALPSRKRKQAVAFVSACNPDPIGSSLVAWTESDFESDADCGGSCRDIQVNRDPGPIGFDVRRIQIDGFLSVGGRY